MHRTISASVRSGYVYMYSIAGLARLVSEWCNGLAIDRLPAVPLWRIQGLERLDSHHHNYCVITQS